MFRLKIWIRKFWRRRCNRPFYVYGKVAKYFEAFSWLAPLVPLQGSVESVAVKRVTLQELYGFAYGGWPSAGRDYYLCDPKGNVLASPRHTPWFYSPRRRFHRKDTTVYDALIGLGGHANAVKYIVEVDWCRDRWNLGDGEYKEKRSRSARITISKFPPHVIPLHYATQLVQEADAKRLVELEQYRIDSAKEAVKQEKELAKAFQKELAAVA